MAVAICSNKYQKKITVQYTGFNTPLLVFMITINEQTIMVVFS